MTDSPVIDPAMPVPSPANDQPQEAVITPQQVMEHLASILTTVTNQLPDFEFTLIARNITNPGQDLILTPGDPMLPVKVITEAIRKRDAARKGKIIA